MTIEEMLQRFDEDYSKYEKFTDALKVSVEKKLIETRCPYVFITKRTKDRDSFKNKIMDNGNVRSLEQIDDISGVRIISKYQDDVKICYGKIKECFKTEIKRPPDKLEIGDVEKFEYRLPSMILRASNNSTEFHDFGDMDAEVQFRSLLEHAWASVGHEFYKEGTPHPEILRDLASMNALIEIADREFIRIREKIHDLRNIDDEFKKDSFGKSHINMWSFKKYLIEHGNLREWQELGIGVKMRQPGHKQGLLGSYDYLDYFRYDLMPIIDLLKNNNISNISQLHELLQQIKINAKSNLGKFQKSAKNGNLAIIAYPVDIIHNLIQAELGSQDPESMYWIGSIISL